MSKTGSKVSTPNSGQEAPDLQFILDSYSNQRVRGLGPGNIKTWGVLSRNFQTSTKFPKVDNILSQLDYISYECQGNFQMAA